jgi:hypothetical protein
LVAADEPLLALFVLGLSKANELARGEDVAAWEKAVRVTLSIGTKLRLTPQATTDPQQIGRRRKDDPGGCGIGWWQIRDGRGYVGAAGRDDDDDDDDTAAADGEVK